MKKNFSSFVIISFLMLLLSGCIPGVGVVILAPEFRLRPEGLQVIHFTPPIIGSGNLVLRLPMDVYNPNSVSLEVSRIDFDFFVNSRLAINSSFSQGFGIASQRTKTFPLDITIPLLSGVLLVQDLIGLAEGDYTTYRLDGEVTVNVLDVVRIFARTTLIEGAVN